MTQPKPAQIEVFRGGTNVSDLAAGYQSAQKEGGAVVAAAKVADENLAVFAVEDRWTVSGAVLSLSRKVSVIGTETNAGFYSAVRLVSAPAFKWEDVKCLVPGLLYDDPSHAGGNSPAGVAPYRAKRFTIREDYLSAPLLGVSFPDGNWAAVLDPAPRGDDTEAENTAPAATPIIDERIQFGAVGAREISGGGIELGFWLPGTTTEIGGGGRRGGGAAGTQTVRRRYHPVKAGFVQNYQVAFRFDKSASILDVERDAWRWAWDSLKPSAKLMPVNVEVARTTLLDHLSDHVLTVGDRSGIPFTISTITGTGGGDMYAKIIMGFCGKIWRERTSCCRKATETRPRAVKKCASRVWRSLTA
jgi:hypothetical protein